MEVLLNVRHYRPGLELARIRTYVQGEASPHILRCNSVPDAMRRIDFATVECDIPEGMTVPAYRRARRAVAV